MQINHKRSFIKGINLRYFSLLIIIWGNLCGMINFLLLKFYSDSIGANSFIPLYYYGILIAVFICNWIYPRVPSAEKLLETIINSTVEKRN